MPSEAWKAFTVALGVNERKSAAPALLFTLLLLSSTTVNTIITIYLLKIGILLIHLVLFFVTEVFKKKAMCIKNSASPQLQNKYLLIRSDWPPLPHQPLAGSA